MTSKHQPKRENVEKRAWNSPKLQDLGNLRQFVQTGNAFGKSFQTTDGDSMAGNESNPKMNQ